MQGVLAVPLCPETPLMVMLNSLEVHMLTSKSDASHLAYCKYTSKHQASGFEFCTVTVCTRDKSVAHQVTRSASVHDPRCRPHP